MIPTASARLAWSRTARSARPKGVPSAAAAGVLTLFLANPDKFVDTAGKITEYAVQQFGKAGVALAGAISNGAVRGVGGLFGSMLATLGIPITDLWRPDPRPPLVTGRVS